MSVSDNVCSPASTAFPLLSVGITDPLCGHDANVVLGVKMRLLDLPTINDINNIVYGDTAVKTQGQ